MTIKLVEAGSLGDKKGRKYLCRLIAAGQGSSGFYSESMLTEYGPTAFPIGTHSFLNHKSYDDEWQLPERRVQDIAGVIVDTPFYDTDGLYAHIEFTEDGAKLVGELQENIGLSIYANGETEDFDGGLNVTRILPSPLNSVDIVTRAGAGGKVMALAESFRAKISTDQTTSNDSGGKVTERIEMDDKDIARIAEALALAIAPSFTALTEALKPVEPVANEGETDYAAVTEAVIESGLPKTIRAKVLEAVKAGTDVTEAIAEGKALVESIQSDLEVSAGVIKESAGDKPSESTYTLGAWS